MYRKILTILVVAFAIKAGFSDSWTDSATGIVWQYTVTDGKVSLGTGQSSEGNQAVSRLTSGVIEIPSEVDGHPVVSIANYAFYLCGNITEAIIPEGITNIGASAFSLCYDMRKVVIPASIVKIGNAAFNYDTSLEYPAFAGNMDAIDMDLASAFRRTPWIESLGFGLVIVNNCVTGFRGLCPSTVEVPEGVREISYGAFSTFYHPSATNLVSITLPESLYYIGNYAFSGCDRLETMNIPADVSYIDNSVFDGCGSLASVTFGREDWLDYYDMTTFSGTPFSDTLPFSLRFEWRSNDEETWKPYVVDYVGRCPAELDIEAVHVAQWEADRQKILKETDGNDDIGEAPAIEGIAEGVFQSCDIKSVVLPASLSVIEYGAFFGCTNMTRIVFTGNAPEEIAEDAFFVHIPEHYNEWYEWVAPYYGPNTNCTVYVPATSTGWGVDIPGEWMGMPIRYSAAGIVEDGVLVSVSLGGDTEFTVPAGVTNIAANAFSGCGDLERVVIPDAVTSIDRTAFDGCGKLWANWYKSMANGAADAASAAGVSEIALTVTNVVVHYVTQSVQSDAVVPSAASGIVNIFGEVVAGSTVVIPSAWVEQYPGFAAKFGSDFTAALTKPTGKRDGAGTAMQVWQDFVAGTDPTDPEDVFKASITFDKDTSEPIISWTPELSEAEAAKRIYRIYGKVRLTDADWSPVNGNASDYNFFRVSVEMK